MDQQALADLERRTVNQVGGDLRATITALTNALTTVYVAVAGSTRHKLPEHAQDTIRTQLADTLKALADQDYSGIRKTLMLVTHQAIEAGGEDFGDDNVKITMPLDLRQALPALTRNMREDLMAASRIARHGKLDRYGDLLAVLTAARKAANHADATAVWVVHRAHNEGRSRAIERTASRGQRVYRMWRAERGACPSCLGYAGALAEPGEPFEPVFMVADASARPEGPLWGPPAHPACRCEVDQWEGHGPDDLDPVDLPHALRREAQRSVLRGDAQGSDPAKIRAADRLLDVADLLVPKTVQKRARKAVAAGTFEP